MGLGLKRKYYELKDCLKNSCSTFCAADRKWLEPHLKLMFHPVKIEDYKSVPIVINNFNRLTMLCKLIDSLTVRGYHNIYIIDNASTYPPLLEWYASCPYPVYMLHKNVGHLSIWETGIYKQFTDSYFAYTDSDLELSEDCPDDFMEKFISLLKKYPKALKAGFALRIDDLPECFVNRNDVIDWESQFWRHEVEPGVYDAPIDTTFAVYKPYFRGELIDMNSKYFRTGEPYTARHLPWYVDSANKSEEETYYVSHLQTMTHWSEKS